MAPATLSAKSVSKKELDLTAEFTASLPQDSAVAVMLQNVVDAISRGDDVSFLLTKDELTPNQASRLLNVSRPYLLKVMDRGLLEFRNVGRDRRIAVSDLLDYVERQERGNARVQELLSTRAHSDAQVRDEAATLDEGDLSELDSLLS